MLECDRENFLDKSYDFKGNKSNGHTLYSYRPNRSHLHKHNQGQLSVSCNTNFKHTAHSNNEICIAANFYFLRSNVCSHDK